MDFNLTSQVCTTKEQSERLLALGLKKETADMYYTDASLPFIKGNLHLVCEEYRALIERTKFQIDAFTFIPAWSLHRLIELYKSVEDTSMWRLEDITYDHLIQCIGLAIKHGGFNKEYLEE